MDIRRGSHPATRRAALLWHLVRPALSVLLLSCVLSLLSGSVGTAHVRERTQSGGAGMSLLGRAAKAYETQGGARGMSAANPLSPSTIYRAPFGVRDYAEPINARNAYMTIASVFGCVSAYAKNYPQIRFEVQHLDGTPWPEHPAQWLIWHPNADMSERRLALYNSIYKPLGGATMLHLYRSDKNARHIIGWRPYSTNEITPVPQATTAVGRESWIERYMHIPLAGAPESIEWNNVIPLTWHSVNPLIPQAYLSPIAAAFEDINADRLITSFPARLLKNSAFISYVFALGAGSEKIPDAAMEKIRADLGAQSTGDNAFAPMLLRAGGTATAIHPDLRRMDLANLGERPETRICIALDVPIRYMGFTAGIDASTSDNYVASWLAFVKGPIAMQAQLDSDALTEALTNPMRNIQWSGHPTNVYGTDSRATNEFQIVPNMSGVEALKSELLKQHEDARANFTADGTTLDEFRSDIGKPKFEDKLAALGEKLYSDLQLGSGIGEPADVTGRASNVMKTPQVTEL